MQLGILYHVVSTFAMKPLFDAAHIFLVTIYKIDVIQ